jgi:hypothetical protein
MFLNLYNNNLYNKNRRGTFYCPSANKRPRLLYLFLAITKRWRPRPLGSDKTFDTSIFAMDSIIKFHYKRAAELGEAASESLQFPNRCSILKIVRTHFAACGGEEAPRKNERLRREPDNFKFLNNLSINYSSKFFNRK